MKICIFCRFFHPHIGGNETQAMLLSKGLVGLGHEVTVITGRTSKSYPKHEEYNGIKIHRVAELYDTIKSIKTILQKLLTLKTLFKKSSLEPTGDISMPRQSKYGRRSLIAGSLSLKYFDLNAQRCFNKHKNDFDIIHCQMLGYVSPIALKASIRLDKPLLVKDATFGGLNLFKEYSNVEQIKEQLRNRASFVAISSQIVENLKEHGITSDKIFNISNGIDLTDIESRNNNKAKKNTILYVGNFWQGDIKGLDVIIRAIGEVVKVKPDIVLNIAGRGNIETYKELTKQCGCENQVRFLGQVRDTDSLYRNNFIFVLPSRQEGMSNSTLEAMSYGMPCVVTDVSGSRDQIDSGLNGIITPIEDHNAMAEALIFMLNNHEDAVKMGELAKQKIIANFGSETNTLKHLDVYNSILSEYGATSKH